MQETKQDEILEELTEETKDTVDSEVTEDITAETV